MPKAALAIPILLSPIKWFFSKDKAKIVEILLAIIKTTLKG
jgi:hypothetical protein